MINVIVIIMTTLHNLSLMVIVYMSRIVHLGFFFSARLYLLSISICLVHYHEAIILFIIDRIFQLQFSKMRQMKQNNMEIMLMAVIFFSTLLILYQAAFSYNPNVIVLNLFFEIFFWIEIYLKFQKYYYDEYSMENKKSFCGFIRLLIL